MTRESGAVAGRDLAVVDARVGVAPGHSDSKFRKCDHPPLPPSADVEADRGGMGDSRRRLVVILLATLLLCP